MEIREMEGLLKRPLTLEEKATFKQDYARAVAFIEAELGYSIGVFTDTLTFESREGFSTLFTPVFSSISSVKVNGKDLSSNAYYASSSHALGGVYNSIILKERMRHGDLIEITAAWGVDECSGGIGMLIAGAYSVIVRGVRAESIKSKSIEDFSVTYQDAPAIDRFYGEFGAILRRFKSLNIQGSTIFAPKAQNGCRRL